jgi:hypothetical protein
VYSDDVTECLAALFLDHDAATALAKLETAAVVLEADPFCGKVYAGRFVAAVKELVAEFYVKLYARASVARIAGLVGRKAEEVKEAYTREGAQSDVKLVCEPGKEVCGRMN